MNINDIMTTDLITCNVDETLAQAAQKMQRENIGFCPVVQNNQLVGVLTDRDIAVRAVALGEDVNTKTVSSIMTPTFITGDPNMSLEDACLLMSENQIRRLPIVENGELIGVVALADLAIDFDEEDIVAQTLEKISEPAR